MAQSGPLLRSQRLRMVNHQGDALRLGMNWTEEDLGKPQVLVDSAYGMGHPGTFHFRELIEEVSNGVYEAGGKPGVFAVSDICDGVVQATDGMSYSLVSRDIMAAMVEIHALGHPHDGMVLISGNDKSVPAHMLAIARCDLPAIHLPGGTQLNASEYVTSSELWPMGAAVERGELPRQDLERAQRGACPTCGACQFMGSASTGQVLAEALGLALPGSALVPAPMTKLLRYARATGKQLVSMIQQHLTPRRILTRDAFENAIIMHAAIGGSTNALLHIPPMAREAGVDVTIDDFDRIHRRVPVLANVKTTGRYPVEYFWYAGGVPAVMLELREMLHLECLTVTGKTLGENLEAIEHDPFFFAERRGYLKNVKVDKDEIIRPRSDPFGPDGGVAVLYGNLAPDGAMIKTFAVPEQMHVHTGPAAATRRGILVTNVPNDWCQNEVADHAMALLLAAARKICGYDRATRAGTWRWQSGEPIHRLQGRTLGLLAFGAIAQAVAARAHAFGMRVVAHDPYLAPDDVAEHGAQPVSFDELIEYTDYLVIQAPLTEQTHHLIGEPELRRMKPTSILVNTARGPIIDDDALYAALKEGWIAGAGLDDIEEEPAKQRNWKPANPLFTLENVIITPHAAYYSDEAIHTVRDFAAHEVTRVLTGRPPLSPVNSGELAMAHAGSAS